MSILAFKENLLGGGARPNQFRVGLFFPVQLSIPLGFTAGARSEFLVEGASLPGQTIGVTPLMYRGREVKLAGERRFDNWQVTVINDGNFSIHSAVEQWMNGINNLRDNTGNLTAADYQTDLYVEQLDRNMAAGAAASIKSYLFKNAWPVSISPIQLNFGDNDNIERFQVEFALDWFESSAVPL